MKGKKHGAGADEAVSQSIGLFLGHAQNLGGLRGYQNLHRSLAPDLDLVALRRVDQIQDGFFSLGGLEGELFEKADYLRVVLFEKAQQEELRVELVLPHVDELHGSDVDSFYNPFRAVTEEHVIHRFHERIATL